MTQYYNFTHFDIFLVIICFCIFLIGPIVNKSYGAGLISGYFYTQSRTSPRHFLILVWTWLLYWAIFQTLVYTKLGRLEDAVQMLKTIIAADVPDHVATGNEVFQEIVSLCCKQHDL